MTRLMAWLDEATAGEARAVAARLRYLADFLVDGSFKAFVEHIADRLEETL